MRGECVATRRVANGRVDWKNGKGKIRTSGAFGKVGRRSARDGGCIGK